MPVRRVFVEGDHVSKIYLKFNLKIPITVLAVGYCI